MPADLDPQLALDERVITDPDLEAALERRLRAKQDVAEAQGVVKSAHDDAMRELAKHPPIPAETAYRVGRFRISIRHVEGRSVSFETEDRDQLSIGLVDDEGQPVKRAYRKRVRSEAPTPGDEALEPTGIRADDDVDLRPTGEVNADALIGEAQRSVLPEPRQLRPH